MIIIVSLSLLWQLKTHITASVWYNYSVNDLRSHAMHSMHSTILVYNAQQLLVTCMQEHVR